MSWTELRSVALVGTDKRQVIDPPPAVLPPDASPEVAAMHHAALLGVQRRAGKIITTAAAEPEGEPVVVPDETNVPREAAQLIELILGGNVVPPSMNGPLIERWLDECAAGGYVIPHRSMISLLHAGTRSKELRSLVRPVLGHRGRWIAGMQSTWQWAEANTEATADVTPDEFEHFATDAKGDYIQQLRTTDPTRAREVIESVFAGMNAADRTQCVASLSEGLSNDDEAFLEACLSDGSKNVREAAQQLLDGLPSSRRAQRMIERIEPLVSAEGRLRKSLTVAWPDEPSKDDKADMTDRGKDSATSQWLQAIVGGTPLDWWEDELGAKPSDILGRKLAPQPELIAGWSHAAGAQRSTPWADALVAHGHVDHRTVEIASDDVLIKAIGKLPKGTKRSIQQKAGVFLNRASPWSRAYGEALIKWAGSNDPEQVSFNYFESSFAQNLDPSLTADVERLIAKAPAGHQQQSLRRVLQILTMHTSITNAFSTGATS